MELNLHTNLEYSYLGEKHLREDEFIFNIVFNKEHSIENVIVLFFYNIYYKKLDFKFRTKGCASFNMEKEVYRLPTKLENEDDEESDFTIIEMTEFEKEVLNECKRITKENDFKIYNIDKKHCCEIRENMIMEELKAEFNAWLVTKFINQENIINYYIFLRDDSVLKITTFRADDESLNVLIEKAQKVTIKDLTCFKKEFESLINKLEGWKKDRALKILQEMR